MTTSTGSMTKTMNDGVVVVNGGDVMRTMKTASRAHRARSHLMNPNA